MGNYEVRFGKVMPFNSGDGAEHPESFFASAVEPLPPIVGAADNKNVTGDQTCK
jgi:hypothetical protein